MTDRHLFRVKIVYKDNSAQYSAGREVATYRVAATDDVMAREKAISAQRELWSDITVWYCEIKHLSEIDVTAEPLP